MATQIQTQIASARKAGYSDQEIFQGILKSPRYGSGFEQARAAGHSNTDIAEGLGLNLGDTQKIQIKDGKANVEMQPIKSTAKAPGKTESFIIGAVNDIGGGINQGVSQLKDMASSGLNSVFGTSLDTGRYDRVTRETKAVNDQHEKRRAAAGKTGTDGWRVAGNIAASIPLTPSISGSTLAVAGKSALSGAGLGGATFAETGEKRLSNMVMGAAGGAVGGVVAKKIGDAAIKGTNIYKGRMKEGVQEVANLGKKHGVQTSVGDLGRNPIIQKTEVQLESIPLVGTSKFRQTQQEQVKGAANKVVDQLKSKLDDVDFKSIDKIRAAANAGDKNANRIMKIVNGAGDDTGKVLQAAAEIKNWRGQRVASQMYNRVQNLAGDGAIAPNKTVQTIDEIIARDSKVTPNKELQKELLDIRKNLGDLNIKKDFKEMRAIQSRLGELADEWGIAGKKGSSAFTKIKTAADDDILDFAQSSGNTKLFGELKRANALYGQLQSGKDKAFAASMRSEKPDEIFKQFMQVGKGDKASNFYKNLDPKGQAALRYQMAENALSKATNESTGSFSPAKFSLEFERMSAPYQNIFKGHERAEIDGFVKLMRHVERSGQYMENPPTGNRVVPYLLGGAAVMEPTSIATTGVLSGTMKILFTTEAGKRILLAAKDLPPNSPKMANLLMQIQKLGTATGANTATK